jgi:hypothetical protein
VRAKARLGERELQIRFNGRFRHIGKVAARLTEVRSMGRSGRDLLTLSSSHFDPQRTKEGVSWFCVAKGACCLSWRYSQMRVL